MKSDKHCDTSYYKGSDRGAWNMTNIVIPVTIIKGSDRGVWKITNIVIPVTIKDQIVVYEKRPNCDTSYQTRGGTVVNAEQGYN